MKKLVLSVALFAAVASPALADGFGYQDGTPAYPNSGFGYQDPPPSYAPPQSDFNPYYPYSNPPDGNGIDLNN